MKYIKSNKTASQDIAGEVIVLHPQIQKFFSLNSAAGFIWGLFDTPRTEEDIVKAMLKEYNAPEELIKKDVRNIIKGLLDYSLIDVVKDPSPHG